MSKRLGSPDALLNIATLVILIGAISLALHPRAILRVALSNRLISWKSERSVRANWPDLSQVAIGTKSASDPSVLIEVLDYQCPICSRVQPILDSAISEGVRVGYILMPKAEHELAIDAAVLALCADESGAFQAAHALLLSDSTWYATRHADPFDKIIPLLPNPEQLRNCMRRSYIKDRLQRHVDLAKQLGARGTPVIVARSGFFRGAITSAALVQFAGQR